MKDIKENGFLELSDEELNQVSGGGLGGGSMKVMKGWVCKNCGNVQGTWREDCSMVIPPNPGYCDNCGTINSFEQRDV